MVTNKDWIKLTNLIVAKEWTKAVTMINVLLKVAPANITLLLLKLHCCTFLYRNITISRCIDVLKKISPDNDIIKDYESNSNHPLLTSFVQSFIDYNLNPLNEIDKTDKILHLLTVKRITK